MPRYYACRVNSSHSFRKTTEKSAQGRQGGSPKVSRAKVAHHDDSELVSNKSKGLQINVDPQTNNNQSVMKQINTLQV